MTPQQGFTITTCKNVRFTDCIALATVPGEPFERWSARLNAALHARREAKMRRDGWFEVADGRRP